MLIYYLPSSLFRTVFIDNVNPANVNPLTSSNKVHRALYYLGFIPERTGSILAFSDWNGQASLITGSIRLLADVDHWEAGKFAPMS